MDSYSWLKAVYMDKPIDVMSGSSKKIPNDTITQTHNEEEVMQ